MDSYVFCQILGNRELYRFNSDIPISDSEENSVIPLSSTLYTQYKFVSKFINDGDAELL